MEIDFECLKKSTTGTTINTTEAWDNVTELKQYIQVIKYWINTVQGGITYDQTMHDHKKKKVCSNAPEFPPPPH